MAGFPAHVGGVVTRGETPGGGTLHDILIFILAAAAFFGGLWVLVRLRNAISDAWYRLQQKRRNRKYGLPDN
jgi:hypothetical protein